MKRFISLLIGLFMALSTFASYTYMVKDPVYDFVVDGICYGKRYAANVSVAGYIKDVISPNLVIPSSVAYNDTIYNVTYLESQCFSYCSDIVSVTIPSSVIYIGDYAFCNCTNLFYVEIINENYFECLGKWAFADCYALKKIKLPDSFVGAIYEGTFYNCKSLVTIELPNSISTIQQSAFRYCESLISIKLPNELERIPEYAFDGCKSLVEIDIPNSVTAIGSEAFCGCESLTSIDIPNSVNEIEDWAFAECRNLTSVKISNNVTKLSKGTFKSCMMESVEIPNSVTTIEQSAFADCINLTSIEIPNSINEIEDWAFEGCENLKTVTNHSSLNIVKGRKSNGYVAYYADIVGLEDIASANYDGTYTLYNIQGVKVLETKDKSEIQSLPKGVYVVKTDLGVEKITIR